MSEKIEIDIVLRAKRGEREAVSKLLACMRQRVFALCFTFLKHPGRAEEACQESLIKIFSRLPSLKKPERFESWCLTISANHCRDLLKRRSFVAVPIDSVPEPRSPEVSEELPERMLEALNSLSEESRQALILRAVEGFSYREISEIQKSALGTVKSRIFEARRKLRKWFSLCDVKS